MDWREEHGKVLIDFLNYMNSRTDKYILKGGTALAQCYGLNRFSEDIDIDGSGNSFLNICHTFAKQHGYECRIAKDTETVKRCLMHYGGVKPLKIEMSSRRAIISEREITTINGIRVYNINTMAILKASAYQQRNKIRDLFDVTFIINNYYDELEETTKLILQNALEYKGLEHFDYIVNNQEDELIDIEILAENFLNAIDTMGVLVDEDERTEIEEDYFNSFSNNGIKPNI